MDPTQEPPGGDSDQPESGPPAASTQDAQDKPADQEPTQPEPGPDATGAILTQAQPSQYSAFDRHRTLIILSTIAALVLVAVLAGVVTALSQPASTSNVRVITPAPASAGGLSRDYADESAPQFQAGLQQFRARFATVMRQHISSFAVAIYTNAPAGGPATAASVAVVYLGYNITAPVKPADAVNATVSGITSQTLVTSTLKVSGLPGDTAAKCIGSTASGRPVAACAWATDKTVSIMVAVTPATTAQVAALLKKMRPDLQSG